MAIESLSAEPNCQKCAIKELWEETEKEDLVSVVRCKDCVYWHSGDMGTGEIYEPYCEMLDTETDERAFCSYGERREQ